VAANQPRIDYDPVTLGCRGLLIEELRTNLLLQSENLTVSPWSNIGVAVTGSQAPYNVTPAAGAGNHYCSQSYSTADNAVVSLTIDAASAGYSHLLVQGKTKSGAYPCVRFDLVAKTATMLDGSGSAAAAVAAGPSGTLRCTLTWNVGTGADPLTFFAAPCPATAATPDFEGDGVSGGYVSRPQLEVGAFPTSYIPTTTAHVTRAADSVSVALGAWHNAAAGTLLVDASAFGNRYPFALAQLWDGSFANRIGLLRVGAAGVTGRVTTGGVQYADLPVPVTAQVSSTRAALAYSAAAVQAVCNGSVTTADSSVTLPVVTELVVGRSDGADTYLNGHVRRVVYWPVRLYSADLQRATQ
jgi:hypothetical protein